MIYLNEDIITDILHNTTINGRIKRNISLKYIDILNKVFDDSTSIKETIYRLKHNILIKPKCPICDNTLEFESTTRGFKKFCSPKCFNKNMKINNPYFKLSEEQKHNILIKTKQTISLRTQYENDKINDKRKQTCFKKYGVEYTGQIPEKIEKTKNNWNNKSEIDKKIIVDKVKHTKLEHYGDEYYNNKEKTIQTCLDKYGCSYAFQSNVVKEKIKQTCLKKYGCINGGGSEIAIQKIKQTKLIRYGDECYCNVDKIKQTLLIHYGVDSFSKTNQFKQLMIDKHDEIQLKSYITKKQNHSFNISKPEDTCYEILKEKYPDVIRQYRDDRYPFNCDFYVPSKDLFIEYQGSWTHGGKPFEGTLGDLLKLQDWCEKNTMYYDNAIYTWTELDVKKRNIAKQNKLNYLEIWPNN